MPHTTFAQMLLLVELVGLADLPLDVVQPLLALRQRAILVVDTVVSLEVFPLGVAAALNDLGPSYKHWFLPLAETPEQDHAAAKCDCTPLPVSAHLQTSHRSDLVSAVPLSILTLVARLSEPSFWLLCLHAWSSDSASVAPCRASMVPAATLPAP